MPAVSMSFYPYEVHKGQGGNSKTTYTFDTAVDAGLRAIDTALIYGDFHQRAANLFVNYAVEKRGVDRSELFVTSKIPCCPGQPFSHCEMSTGSAEGDVDAALGYFDSVDLLLMHWPCLRFEDTLKTWRALENAQKAGRVRAIGVSNFNSSALQSLVTHATIPPAVDQCGFALGVYDPRWRRDLATVQLCQALGITYEAYGGLGGSIPGWSHADFSALATRTDLAEIARALGKTPEQIALQWTTQHGQSNIVTSTQSAKHLAQTLEVGTGQFQLSEDEMTKLDQIHLKNPPSTLDPC